LRAVGRDITAGPGPDVILSVYAHRVLALAGVALVLWALPRLARRSSPDAGRARPASRIHRRAPPRQPGWLAASDHGRAGRVGERATPPAATPAVRRSPTTRDASAFTSGRCGAAAPGRAPIIPETYKHRAALGDRTPGLRITRLQRRSPSRSTSTDGTTGSPTCTSAPRRTPIGIPRGIPGGRWTAADSAPIDHRRGSGCGRVTYASRMRSSQSGLV